MDSADAGSGRESEATLSRRSFVIGGVALAGGALIGCSSSEAASPRVAIVGAGLAGLTCAHRLAQAGRSSVVYEANPDRLGGRCWSAHLGDGQVAEHGGEFIDTSHSRIRRLATELGLSLEDGREPSRSESGLSARYVIGGQERREAELWRGWGLLTRQAARDAAGLGNYLRRAGGPKARALDEMTSREWLERAAPGSSHAVLRAAVSAYFASLYGLDPDRLSGMVAVAEFGPLGHGSDERFHVAGGNDLIVSGLRERLPSDAVRSGWPLESLADRSGGGYTLGFAGGREESADVVVLCLPFTALRRADLTGLELSLLKRRCIAELGMGTNSKLLLPFERRPGAYDRWNGEYFDERIWTWDSTLAQPGRGSIVTSFSGGRAGTAFPPGAPHEAAPGSVTAATLARVGRTVPGVASGYAGDGWLDVWARDPWTHGSYAAFLPGQYTRFWGRVGRAEGNLHFGGEHTSTRAQGYLEGAVESGERCAREVLGKTG